MLVVELDVFSGRANPQWRLDADGEQRLRTLHRALPQRGVPAVEPPGLGYRGFRYMLDGVRWRAWNGTVSGEGRGLEDPGRRVERLLLELVPPEYAEVRGRIADELDSPS
jgi:hypothetical protein